MEFIAQGGARLREHALFEAVHAHWMGGGRCQADWRRWPQEWHGPAMPAVVAFAAASAQEVRYHQFLQWLATVSFTRAQDGARDVGMRIGLIADLAIGMDPAGSHAWTRPGDLLTGLSVGAPPDIYIPSGQDWGLVAISPMALVDTGFEPFIATVRAALRHAGGLRIDHAMGLLRLWLVPHGSSAAEGAYLNYPLDDLLRLLALESHRHQAVVVGEDLGTVPPEFRSRLRDAGVAGMDVLWFQRDGERFQRPIAVAARRHGDDHDARPANRRGLVERKRYRRTRAAWHRRRRGSSRTGCLSRNAVARVRRGGGSAGATAADREGGDGCRRRLGLCISISVAAHDRAGGGLDGAHRAAKFAGHCGRASQLAAAVADSGRKNHG